MPLKLSNFVANKVIEHHFIRWDIFTVWIKYINIKISNLARQTFYFTYCIHYPFYYFFLEKKEKAEHIFHITKQYTKIIVHTKQSFMVGFNNWNSSNNFVLQVVKGHVKTKCKCHGVSGTCTVKTCWRQLAPFHEIGQVLKRRYEKAYKVDTNTNNANGKFSLSIRREESNTDPQNSTPKSVDMVYIENSPSFCSKSSYSIGTAGRECNKNNTCHSICCGRGYNVMTRKKYERCQCQVVWCCEFNCNRCLIDQELYTCKWTKKRHMTTVQDVSDLQISYKFKPVIVFFMLLVTVPLYEG